MKQSARRTYSSQYAENFSRTRSEHAREIAEDYVEVIASLIAETGEARVVDLAKRLGVTHVTVNRTVSRLQKSGYVKSEPYRAIFLTTKGRQLAAACKTRHEVVVAFLRSLGVSERTAQMDAEGIEHHVSPQTLGAFKKALKENSKSESRISKQTRRTKMANSKLRTIATISVI